ncbi:hypothetical protein DSO57_1007831 [Entomophthora muscae]|uniref:Uncharacterized protein n=1 Tax=Entomophthora muscae TaxID=34485 RepID=A0ACC2RYH6_9FUNG|nr:hypothetical protein DSO57_1007831 [Entomophthora muscae]
MNLGLAQSMGLLLLPPQILMAASKLLLTAPVGGGSPKLCLSLKALPETPPSLCSARNAGSLQRYLQRYPVKCPPPHYHYDLTFKLTVDLIKIDTPMYPLSELKDKALSVWLNNMLAKGWIVKKASLVSSPSGLC